MCTRWWKLLLWGQMCGCVSVNMEEGYGWYLAIFSHGEDGLFMLMGI